jgi:endonuclease/exonuclease/phosphatase family metal-dependent hydrolase
VEHLLAYLDTLPSARPCFVIGDFNCVPESLPIQAITDAGAGRSRSLRDTWREANPTDPGPTMPSQAPVIRIDYIFVCPGPAILRSMRLGDRADTDGFYPSDHLGVAATLQIPSTCREPF